MPSGNIDGATLHIATTSTGISLDFFLPVAVPERDGSDNTQSGNMTNEEFQSGNVTNEEFQNELETENCMTWTRR